MLHLVLYGLLAVVLAGGLFLVAARFLPAGEQIAPPLRDEPPWALPADRTLHPEDVDSVRLPVALRGYRFAETDILLDRLATELRARDEEIARLRVRVPGAAPEPAPLTFTAPTAGEPAPADDTGAAAPPAADAAYAPPPATPWAPPWNDTGRPAVPPPFADEDTPASGPEQSGGDERP